MQSAEFTILCMHTMYTMYIILACNGNQWRLSVIGVSINTDSSEGVVICKYMYFHDLHGTDSTINFKPHPQTLTRLLTAFVCVRVCIVWMVPVL